ncbi:MAG: hypothetical protein GKR89_35600 [Candidatus Latescibacteria bacterium]|nr:hypothetical protein [Candidatus Latescibacterota bacterium]
MIRITQHTQTNRQTILQIEGDLVGPAVAILAREGWLRLRAGSVLVLDLSGLQIIDEAGVALLQDWAEPVLRLQGASRSIQLLLEGHGLAVEEGGKPPY